MTRANDERAIETSPMPPGNRKPSDAGADCSDCRLGVDLAEKDCCLISQSEYDYIMSPLPGLARGGCAAEYPSVQEKIRSRFAGLTL